MEFIDTHAHIYYDDYKNSIDDVIKRANDKGVEKIISIGVDLNTSEECIELAEKFVKNGTYIFIETNSYEEEVYHDSMELLNAAS